MRPLRGRKQAEAHAAVGGRLLERVFRAIVAEGKHSLGYAILRLGAGFLAWAYGIVVHLRDHLFDLGVLRSHKVGCRVISVGNLTVGGTGKTPMVMWLARFLAEENWRIAIVSRGYRRLSGNRLQVVSDGRSLVAGAAFSGDEPQLLARRLPGVPVICCGRRVAAARLARRRFHTEVVILDDGFQHRAIARDLDIVMLDAHSPLGNGKLLPRGILREPWSALRRAQALVLSRFDGSSRARANRQNLAHQWPTKPVFLARYRPARLFAAAGGSELPLAFLRNRRLAAFAGIARPDDFFRSLEALEAELVFTRALPDHHPLGGELLERLVREAAWLEPELWLSTEKDWVRLPEVLPPGMNLWILAIEVDLGDQDLEFRAMVRKSLRSPSS